MTTAAPPETPQRPDPNGRLPTWTELQRRAWRAPAELSVSEWCDQNRWLPDLSDQPGKWRTSWTPYLREPMDNLQRRWVRQTTFMGSTQIGKTELLNNVVAWIACQTTSTIVYVSPRAKDCRQTMRHRVLPMFQASP
jgi:phage terminase large subunit GpA-like protein